MVDEGVLDPWVAEWIAANPMRSTPFEDLSPEILELARGPVGEPPTREIAHVTDDFVGDVPIRMYRNDTEPTGLVVYFHGGGFVIGSIGLMDNVARELTRSSGAVVISVEYRLAPDHPFPAGFEDCASVTQWALDNSVRFGVPQHKVVVAGESAGGNLAAATALHQRDIGGPALAGQVLIYPGTAGPLVHPSTFEFDGLIISRRAGEISGPPTAVAKTSTPIRMPRPYTLRASPTSRRPWSCSAGATCSTTRDVPTPLDSVTTESRSTRCAIPISLTALLTLAFQPLPRRSSTSEGGCVRPSRRQMQPTEQTHSPTR